MLWLGIAVSAVTLAIPYLPYTGLLGFQALPGCILFTIAAILVAYGLSAELAKRPFYRKAGGGGGLDRNAAQAVKSPA